MALRTANNPVPSRVLFGALAQVIVPNTRLQLVNPADPTGLKQVFIRDRYSMATQGIFPAVNITGGPLSSQIVSNHAREGGIVAIIDYYDRWDQSPLTIDTILQNMAEDLEERIMANIESNDSLVVNAVTYATAAPLMKLSPDKGTEDNTFPGLLLLHRTLTVQFNIPPYYV
jgi:hypothetical protein